MLHAPASFTLPGPAQGWIEALAQNFLTPEGMTPIDFAEPAGEEALTPADSVAWRIFKNPLVLFVGGIAAVLLELGEPRIREGVWAHSRFRQDSLGRLRRTGLAAMVTVYGPRSKAEAMIAGVNRMHGRITGTTPEGYAYRADDPELLDWVQATAAFGIIETYAHFVRPLSHEERDRAYAEGRPAAALYGAHGAPGSQAELDTIFERHRALLAPTPIVSEFLSIMADTPVLPAALHGMQPMLLKASVSVLPAWVRRRLRLGPDWTLNPIERRLVRAAAKGADRLILRSSPAVQSCRRLGLCDDYLYRRP